VHTATGFRAFESASQSGKRSTPSASLTKPVELALQQQWLVPIAMLLMVAAALLVYDWTRPAPVPQVSNYKQLTHEVSRSFWSEQMDRDCIWVWELWLHRGSRRRACKVVGWVKLAG
jgi:hypothetical protein